MKVGGTMKKESYCFSNKECEYYPCHKYEEGEEFNCLFCYCPLYKMEKCLGNPKYIINKKGQTVKSCVECTFPHHPKNYSKVIAYLANQNEVLTIELSQIKRNMDTRLAKISGFENMEVETRMEHEAIAEYIYECYLKDRAIEVLLQPFSGQCVTKEGFHFNENAILSCDILEKLQLEQEDIISGYIYTFCAPVFSKQLQEEYEKLPLLEQYYVENWLISVLDASRDWIRNYLLRKHSVLRPAYVTDSFGPGFYGMAMEQLPELFRLIDGETVGVSLNDNNSLNPLKSCIGIYVVTKKDVSYLMGHDCVNCAGSKFGCTACRVH